MAQDKSQEPKRDWGFYATTPRIVRTQYKELSHAEKWLYTCLKDLCGDKGSCFRSLRSLSEETDISIASLSKMIPHLHEVGLIHAEKKRRSASGKEVWHISIVDIWQANAEYCKDCSKNEQGQEDRTEVVQKMNEVVQNLNEDTRGCSKNERGCSNFSDRRITMKNTKNEEYKEEESVPGKSATQAFAPNVALSPIPQNPLLPSFLEETQEEGCFPIGGTTTRNDQSVEQNTPIDVDKSIPPVMPSETAKWSAETVVQIVEARLNKRFLEVARGKSQKSQRERQLEAGKKIIAAKVTRDEFIRAYDNRNDQWWIERNGELTVVEMAANTHNRVMRTLEVLENMEKRKPTGGRVIDISSRGSSDVRPSFLVSEEQKQKNIDKLRALAAAKAAKE